MMKKWILPMIFAFSIICGCSGELSASGSAEQPTPTPPSTTEPESAPPVDAVETLLNHMTLEEKVGQIFFVRCPEENAAEDVAQYHLGGVLLFGRDFKDKTASEIRTNLSLLQNAAEIPLLIGTDEEGGTVVRASSNPNLCSNRFEAPMKLYAEGGLSTLAADSAEKSAFLLNLGVNVNFAPVADVPRNQDSFIYPRTLGLDAEGTSEGVKTMVSAMKDAGIGSVIKHFPGYGDNADTHTGVAIDARPYETFLNWDFLPFRAGIEAGCGSILVSHNVVLCMDEDLPASLSPKVHRILREELQFDGVVLTDDLAMDALKSYTKNGAAAVMALQAGNDMIVTTDYQTQIPAVLAAVNCGDISESTLDMAVKRILHWKLSLGLLNNIAS